jgi:hypothetical protein
MSAQHAYVVLGARAGLWREVGAAVAPGRAPGAGFVVGPQPMRASVNAGRSHSRGRDRHDAAVSVRIEG